ncbi:hypothetical protein BCR33DRAFT_746121 [Rhizoclosmatium globosum]|uniref:Uncharacterized protein n=1 Tax=Rhizoclosmatium globosum TaxID=329046 RepID=A0A1Y2AXH5_9FUNG|nr:hypothetical protein BCR33DRAFT_746121 [Rhizoclosmatium globosum]|eukprot:ORY27289.1 hypothetical protein BCR33DRAFT_746121 [Rhizoclosmatium globosum]
METQLESNCYSYTWSYFDTQHLSTSVLMATNLSNVPKKRAASPLKLSINPSDLSVCTWKEWYGLDENLKSEMTKANQVLHHQHKSIALKIFGEIMILNIIDKCEYIGLKRHDSETNNEEFTAYTQESQNCIHIAFILVLRLTFTQKMVQASEQDPKMSHLQFKSLFHTSQPQNLSYQWSSNAYEETVSRSNKYNGYFYVPAPNGFKSTQHVQQQPIDHQIQTTIRRNSNRQEEAGRAVIDVRIVLEQSIFGY